MRAMIEDNDSTATVYQSRNPGNREILRSFDFLNFFFQRKFLRKRIPLLTSFKITYRCNLTCAGCPFHRKAREKNSHMSWRTAITTLQRVKATGCPIIVFEGGEPFIWKDGLHDFHALVRYAKELFRCVAVTTNGTFPLNAPADVLWVSLDGTRHIHNRLRNNSFDRVLDNLVTTRHPNILVHLTLNKENWHDLNRIAGILQTIPSIRGMTVQLFYPYNQGEKPLALSRDERAAALENVIQLKRRGYPILNSASRLRAMIGNTWTCHDDILVNVNPDGSILTGCYVKNRGPVNCAECGFTPVAEASGAVDFIPGSLYAGWRIFAGY
jgi:MoaA/NifB/PqqE/SkfB family radical SAM enzyme